MNWLSAPFMVFHQLKVMLACCLIVLFAQGTHLLSVFFIQGLSGIVQSVACSFKEYCVDGGERGEVMREKVYVGGGMLNPFKDSSAFVLLGWACVFTKRPPVGPDYH